MMQQKFPNSRPVEQIAHVAPGAYYMSPEHLAKQRLEYIERGKKMLADMVESIAMQSPWTLDKEAIREGVGLARDIIDDMLFRVSQEDKKLSGCDSDAPRDFLDLRTHAGRR